MNIELRPIIDNLLKSRFPVVRLIARSAHQELNKGNKEAAIDFATAAREAQLRAFELCR